MKYVALNFDYDCKCVDMVQGYHKKDAPFMVNVVNAQRIA